MQVLKNKIIRIDTFLGHLYLLIGGNASTLPVRRILEMLPIIPGGNSRKKKSKLDLVLGGNWSAP